jgi:hypothetical protein
MTSSSPFPPFVASSCSFPGSRSFSHHPSRLRRSLHTPASPSRRRERDRNVPGLQPPPPARRLRLFLSFFPRRSFSLHPHEQRLPCRFDRQRHHNNRVLPFSPCFFAAIRTEADATMDTYASLSLNSITPTSLANRVVFPALCNAAGYTDVDQYCIAGTADLCCGYCINVRRVPLSMLWLLTDFSSRHPWLVLVKLVDNFSLLPPALFLPPVSTVRLGRLPVRNRSSHLLDRSRRYLGSNPLRRCAVSQAPIISAPN